MMIDVEEEATVSFTRSKYGRIGWDKGRNFVGMEIKLKATVGECEENPEWVGIPMGKGTKN